MLFLIYSWAAILSAAATALTFIVGIQFFSGENKITKLADVFVAMQFLLMIPLVLFFDRLITPPTFLGRLVSAVFGLGGIVVSAYGQIRLLANRISFEESQKFFPARAAIGFWLIMVNFSLVGTRTLPPALIWIGIVAGVGYLLIAGGFGKRGQRAPLSYGGSYLLGICYPAWGFWLGKIIFESLLQ